MNRSFLDKRIVLIYIITIILIFIGITLAFKEASYSFMVDTGDYGIDESAYGETSFDSSSIDLKPIFDNEIGIKPENVIKIDFTVGGAEFNPTNKKIIYDITLNDLNIDCELLSPYIKWKLLKNGEEISSGSLSNSFDTIIDNRLVLTNTQLDLPAYNSSKTGYDNYNFYLWVSDSCQSENLSECINEVDQAAISGKSIAGRISVELNTGFKTTNTRHPTTGDACSNVQRAIFDTKGGDINISSKTVVAGQKYGTLPIPTKENYTFAGWYLDEDYILEVKENSIVGEEKNIILYAKWLSDILTINYGYNIEQITMIGSSTNSCNVTSSSSRTCDIVLPSITPATGYVSLGWYEGETKIGDPNETITISTNIDLTAKARYINATEVSYDNSNTGVNCSTVQCMIEEIDQILN